MDALGFDLYTQMLERTVAELRGEEVSDEASVTINLGVDVSIPEEFIGDMGQRLRTYKRVSRPVMKLRLLRLQAKPGIVMDDCRKPWKTSLRTLD